jgi:hypothetical protein
MPNLAIALMAIALQQGPPGAATGLSSPASGDTVGYWQQRVHYQISAMLDEGAQRVRASGTLWYVNNSPDTLRELYFHQYLNAFRPGSKWSEVDEREGRDRFQHLTGTDFGYEHFTGPVRVDGAAVVAEYPGAPDSTVVRVALPRPLPPRDSTRIALQWEARPSVVPRRQARNGRHWDLAQWYPKVAVYDRGGWQYNALQPAGEFYGEFGTYDVTLIVPVDQVIAATGVPIAGDPGWARVARAGSTRLAAQAYGDLAPSSSVAPPGHRAVRFYAKDVHHFAWTASPEYRYEGGVYTRSLPATHFPTWDTVSVHVLYRPGDDSTWGGQRVVRRTIAALQWFEAIFGPYPYPQLTAHHRIDGGGTETPMMMMNGSPSQGLILHEGGHMYAYGALANNEWRSGWMDEGLTSYQTAWAQLLTPLERNRAGITDRFVGPRGYRANAIQMQLPRFEVVALNQATRDLHGRARPLGTMAHEFPDFDTYNAITYDRAEVMFSQLRDLLGDTVFVRFLRDYHDHWALKHVDERAMRSSAERVSGRDLGWFFDQWVRRTGVMDYSIRGVRRSRDSVGRWVTEVTVDRQGEFRHPMPVGVRTRSGWTFSRMANLPFDREIVRLTTTEEPIEVQLDPLHVTWDWDRRGTRRLSSRQGIDWPFLTQADRDRALSLWLPMAWYSRPGGLNAGFRNRAHYLDLVDRFEGGVVLPTVDSSGARDWYQRSQLWFRFENPYLSLMNRPAMGWHGGVARLDDVLNVDIGHRRERLGVRRSKLTDVSATYTLTQGQELLPESWIGNSTAWSIDLAGRSRDQWGSSEANHVFVESHAVLGVCRDCRYGKAEASIGGSISLSQQARFSLRAYGARSSASRDSIPKHRALYVSAADPVSTFRNHWWRPRESIFKQRDVGWLPLGGAALRGYHWSVTSPELVAVNVELAHRVGAIQGEIGELDISLGAFGDAGYESKRSLIDAGFGVKVRGRFFDQPVNLRLDFPIYVSRPALAINGRSDNVAPRWVITFNDIW